MRGLAGDFQTMPLEDLVVYLDRRRATGVLVFETGSVKKELRLDEGAITAAMSNLPRESLGQHLFNVGALTEEQYQRVFVAKKERTELLGKILLEDGLVARETLAAVLETKFRETLLDVFTWPDGLFRLEPGPKPSAIAGVEVHVPLASVLQEAAFRREVWKQIRAAFPSGACTLTVDRAKLAEPPKPGSVDERLLAGIESGQTIDELALRVHAIDYFIYSRLYGWHLQGALSVRPPEAPRPRVELTLGLGDSPTAEQLLANARAFFERSNFRDAWALAKRSHEVTPTLGATLLLRQLEQAWAPQLKADLLQGGRVPAPLLAAEQVTKLPLSAPERYLLSRVDGHRDVASIVRLAPLKEFDALVAFDRFAAQKWVRLP